MRIQIINVKYNINILNNILLTLVNATLSSY